VPLRFKTFALPLPSSKLFLYVHCSLCLSDWRTQTFIRCHKMSQYVSMSLNVIPCHTRTMSYLHILTRKPTDMHFCAVQSFSIPVWYGYGWLIGNWLRMEITEALNDCSQTCWRWSSALATLVCSMRIHGISQHTQHNSMS
jgi:hypothetical protein